MFKRIGVVTLWVLATVGTASITLAAVGQVGDRVTQQAAIPIDSADLLASPAIAALASTTTVPATTTAPDEVTTTITDLTEPTTTTSAATGTTTAGTPTTTSSFATSTTTSSSTTTTAAPVGVNSSYALEGGTVTIHHSGDSVSYVSGLPKGSGWSMEVKNRGPSQVVVEFESDSHESRFSVEVDNGELVVDIEEHDEN
jgi:hypothetical protein